MSNNKDGQNTGVDEQKIIQDDQAGPQTIAEREQQAALKDISQKSGERLSMHLRVYSPFRDYYDGSAFSLSAVNATGPFDILPKHHNFMSLLTASELVIRMVPEGEQRIRISGGLMHVKADQVIVFLDV